MGEQTAPSSRGITPTLPLVALLCQSTAPPIGVGCSLFKLKFHEPIRKRQVRVLMRSLQSQFHGHVWFSSTFPGSPALFFPQRKGYSGHYLMHILDDALERLFKQIHSRNPHAVGDAQRPLSPQFFLLRAKSLQ